MIQIYIPSVLTVILSWLSFWISHEATAARMSLGITSVLTLTTLFTASRLLYPAVPYIKSIEWFQCYCFGFAFAALIEFVLVSHYAAKSKGRSKKDEQRLVCYLNWLHFTL